MSDGFKAGINNVPMIVSTLGGDRGDGGGDRGDGTRLDATMTIAAIAMYLIYAHWDDPGIDWPDDATGPGA